MKRTILAMAFLALAVTANAEQNVHSQFVYRQGTQKSFKGSAELFTGDVQVEMLFHINETASYSGAYVIFQPGARTAWHQHPAGQHMIVTSGVALTGTRDGKVIEFEKGESVWTLSALITGMAPLQKRP